MQIIKYEIAVNIFMKKLLILIILLIFSLGCVEPHEKLHENMILVYSFEKYDNPELKSVERLSETEFIDKKDYWEENCEMELEAGQYYEGIYENDLVRLEILAEVSQMNIICIVEFIKIFEENEFDYLYDLNYDQIIDEHGCYPNWSCGEWGECINNKITRECVDLNECDTGYNKPAEITTCNLICEEAWICFDFGECIDGKQERTCFDLNECGTNEFKPEIVKDC